MRTAAMVLLVSLVFMCGVAWQLASDRQVLLQKTVEVTATMKIIGEKLARLEMAKPGEEEVASAVPASEQHSQLRPQCDGRAGDLFGPEWSEDEHALKQSLVMLEKKFSGGIVRNVRCAGGKICMGSDRMSGEKHNYGSCYAKFLNKWRKVAESRPQGYVPLLVAEVGILKGSGLAVWSELFGCAAEVHGFDLVLENTKANMAFMKRRGAFAKENLQLHSINQMEDNGALVAAIASGKKFSFVVDDGFHTLKSIWLTFESFRASLHESFLYVVEDIALDEIGEVKKLFKDYHIDECEADQRIIAVTPKKR